MDRRGALGRAGEQAAERWYIAAGYEVLDRNWRGAAGEIDLVALAPDGCVVICEVKTRSSGAFGYAAEAVTPSKQRRLRRLAATWLAEHRSLGHRRRPVRFDVAAIDGAGDDLVVEVVPDAF